MDPGTTQVSQEGLRTGASGEPLGEGPAQSPQVGLVVEVSGHPQGLINQVGLLLDSWEGVEGSAAGLRSLRTVGALPDGRGCYVPPGAATWLPVPSAQKYCPRPHCRPSQAAEGP